MNYEVFLDKELLINLVKKRPVLWDKTLDIYKDKEAKAEAWREVCRALMGDFEKQQFKQRYGFGKYVIKKWGQTRDSWIRTLNDKKRINKTGAPVRPYRYHKQMLFLKKVIDTPKLIKSEEESITNDDDSERLLEIQCSSSCSNNLDKSTPKSVLKRTFEVDVQVDEAIPHADQGEDRNLLFFKSILPSLALLNDDETLEFQSRVIKLLQNIKGRRGHHYQSHSTFIKLQRGSPKSPSQLSCDSLSD